MLGEIEERNTIVAMVDINHPLGMARHIPVYDIGSGYRWQGRHYTIPGSFPG